MPPQRFEEGDDLKRPHRAWHELEVDVPEADTGDRRQLFPGEAVLQHWRLTLRRPSAHSMRSFRDA